MDCGHRDHKLNKSNLKITFGPVDQKLFLFCHDNCIRIVTKEGGV